MLLLRYPYRAIPRLPPKKMIGGEDRSFIEQRRRALQRFLTLAARHPTVANEHILKFFFTFKGSELHTKIKEHFRGVPDEFMSSSVAQKAKELVTAESAVEFAKSREHLRSMIEVLTRVRDIAERLVTSTNAYASDMHQLSKELSAISSDSTAVSSWATGISISWSQMKKGFRSVAPQFSNLVEISSKQCAQLEEDVADNVGLLLDLLLAYKDLCDRHEKGVLNEHQKTLQKLNHYRKKSSSVQSQPTTPDAVERLESHILEQESEIANVENRSCFALHCIQMETQLVYTSVDALCEALQKMAEDERIAHCELGGAWAQICPLVSSILHRSNSSAVSPTSEPTSLRISTLPSRQAASNNNNNISPQGAK